MNSTQEEILLILVSFNYLFELDFLFFPSHQNQLFSQNLVEIYCLFLDWAKSFTFPYWFENRNTSQTLLFLKRTCQPSDHTKKNFIIQVPDIKLFQYFSLVHRDSCQHPQQNSFLCWTLFDELSHYLLSIV